MIWVKVSYGGSWGKETNLSGLNNDSCQLFSCVHTVTSIQVFIVPFSDGWALGISPTSTFGSVREQHGASVRNPAAQCPGQSGASPGAAQAARARISDRLGPIPALGSCWMPSSQQFSSPGCCGELWRSTNHSYMSLAWAITAHAQKSVKDKRDPGIWQCCSHWCPTSLLFIRALG